MGPNSILEYSYLWYDWDDVHVPPASTEDVLASITSGTHESRALDLFRVVTKSKEYSHRVLALTNDVIQLNSADYTAWVVRRGCIERLKCDLNEELDYVKRVIQSNDKCYQAWYHRRWILLNRINSEDIIESELGSCDELLRKSSKNYNCWAHRSWMVQQFGTCRGQIAFATVMIEQDCFNNSAWSFRRFMLDNWCSSIDSLIKELTPVGQQIDEIHEEGKTEKNQFCSSLSVLPAKENSFISFPVLLFEINYVMGWIEAIAHNEAAGGYLKGLLRSISGKTSGTRYEITDPQERNKLLTVVRIRLEVLIKRFPRNTKILSIQIDVLTLSNFPRSTIIEMYEKLESIDSFREGYWTWKKKAL